MDIQEIQRPNESYNIVACSHIIEHVHNYRKAVMEIVRILKTDGFVYLAYPDPQSREKTEDWGFPDLLQHGHYRIFGRDFETELSQLSTPAKFVAVQGLDEVTGVTDLHYIGTKNAMWLARAIDLVNARLLT